MNCDVTDPQQLWDDTCDWLILAPYHMQTWGYRRNDLLAKAYSDIDKIIQRNNPHESMAGTYHIRPPPPDLFPPREGDLDPQPDLGDLTSVASRMADRLNPEQRAAYDAIMQSILNQEGKQFFIDGPGGTGKSFLYNCIMARLRSHSLPFSACASTGIAATIIDGCTSHKLFGVPMELEHDTHSLLSANCMAAELLRQSSCIIWDEAPASHRYVLELCNRFLQDICSNPLPFGGKTILIGGDWRQTLPVVVRGTNAQTVAACLRMSNLWPFFEENTYILSRNMRASNPAFAEWVLDIGNGISGSIVDFSTHHIRLVHSTRALIQATFGLILNVSTLPALARTAILSPTNKNAALLNEEVFAFLHSPSCFNFSIDYPKVERESNPMVIPEEFLHTLTPPGMPPHRLHLKQHGIYMLLRNMNVNEGMCNGTRFFLEGFSTHVMYCLSIPNDPSKPMKKFMLPRINCNTPKHYPFPFVRRQFPVRAAFCMTINKAQGATLDAVGIDVTSPVFGHGQLYVALSRVDDFHKITVLTPTNESSTRNVVFQEVFDKDYIDTQIRLRTERPIDSSRMDSDGTRIPDRAQNMFCDDDTEAFLDQLDHYDQYDPNDGVNLHDNPDTFEYTHDERAYEEDWVPYDHWQE